MEVQNISLHCQIRTYGSVIRGQDSKNLKISNLRKKGAVRENSSITLMTDVVVNHV